MKALYFQCRRDPPHHLRAARVCDMLPTRKYIRRLVERIPAGSWEHVAFANNYSGRTVVNELGRRRSGSLRTRSRRRAGWQPVYAGYGSALPRSTSGFWCPPGSRPPRESATARLRHGTSQIYRSPIHRSPITPGSRFPISDSVRASHIRQTTKTAPTRSERRFNVRER